MSYGFGFGFGFGVNALLGALPVIITGDVSPGQTLTSTAPGQWELNGVDVSGETGTSWLVPYTVAPGDEITQDAAINILTVPGYDSDAAAYIAAVIAAGGGTEWGTDSANRTNNKWRVNDFIKGIKFDGVWGDIRDLYIYAGPVSLAGILVKARGDGSRTNVNFLIGDLDRLTGLQGDGATKYIANALFGNTLSDTSHGRFVYGSAFPTSGNQCFGGVYDNTEPSIFTLDAVTGGTSRAFRSGKFTAGQFPAIASGLTTSGSIGGTRTSATSAKLYQNGLPVDTNSTPATPDLPALADYSFALNVYGTAAGFSPDRRAIEAITGGLDDAQSLALHNRAAAYVAALL